MVTMSITEASRVGVSALVSSAERHEDVALARHGRVVAQVVDAQELADLRRDRDTLRDAALVMARFATDDGARTELDAVIAAFGLTRDSLGHELDIEHPDTSPDPAGPA
jgi:antitoxin (DNA-binding transcriptional repressor) of toxin-antitoxin stability system